MSHYNLFLRDDCGLEERLPGWQGYGDIVPGLRRRPRPFGAGPRTEGLAAVLGPSAVGAGAGPRAGSRLPSGMVDGSGAGSGCLMGVALVLSRPAAGSVRLPGVLPVHSLPAKVGENCETLLHSVAWRAQWHFDAAGDGAVAG